MGADYTFGIGSGLGISIEHLVTTFSKHAYPLNTVANVSASSIMYPLGFFDTISTMVYYAWNSHDTSFFLNYEHQFKYLSAYAMAYYNPSTPTALLGNSFENAFAGPGLRLMLVYNH